MLLSRPFRCPEEVRRELRQLKKAVNEQHVHIKPGGRTALQYRRGKRLRKLPANFTINTKKLPVALGKVTFIRLVSTHGTISMLGQSFKAGKRLKFQLVKVTIYARYKSLKVYHKGRIIKEFSYPLPVK